MQLEKARAQQQRFSTVKNKYKNKLFKKGRRLEETFLQRKHTDDRVHEKVLKITSYQGVEIRMQYPITAVKKVIIKKTSNNKCR